MQPSRFSFPCLLMFMVLFTLPWHLGAQSEAPDPAKLWQSADAPGEPWHIEADTVSYDQKSDLYLAEGNVLISRAGRRLAADRVRFDQATMQVEAMGHVTLTTGMDILAGDRLVMNLQAETGMLQNGSIFLGANHYHIQGGRIEKIGPAAYKMDKGQFSTCDGPKRAWKITGRDLKITIEGYGSVRDAAFWVKDVPVLYVPYLFFPVKFKRQTGLLAPQIGYSDRLGAEYVQPLFWAPATNKDATLYYQHMSQRGEKFGIEYRQVWSETTLGTMMADGFKDRKSDETDDDQWGYTDDSALRPNTDRFWLRAKHDQDLPWGATAKLDLDLVSDQDYLRDFKTGYMGFDDSEDEFIRSFGRDLDDYNETQRLNKLSLNKTWSAWVLNAQARWYDDVVNRRQSETNTNLQALPLVELTAAKQRLLGSGLYAEMDNEWQYLYKEDSARIERMDVHPRVYLPLTLWEHFTFEPSLGVRQTAWYIDYTNDENLEPAQSKARSLFDLEAELGTELYRIYALDDPRFVKLKHALTPELTWAYIPDWDQTAYPDLDDLDRIEGQNLVTLALTNTFTAKTRNDAQNASDEGQTATPKDLFAYHQFCRFKISQSYDVREAWVDDPDKWVNEKTREPFRPFFSEIEVSLPQNLSFKADAQWSHYRHTLLTHNVAASLWDWRGDSLYTEYRYVDREYADLIDDDDADTDEDEAQTSLYTLLRFKLTDGISAYGEWERDFQDGHTIKTGTGVLFESQCWSLGLNYLEEDDDRKFWFQIFLLGLGQFG